MLTGFGAKLDVDVQTDGTRIISIEGETELKPQDIVVPGDPSSAAFQMVAALLVPGSHIVIENVGLNATRAGLIELLRDMGRSEEHTSELQSLMRISYAVYCLKTKKKKHTY